jgi:hypothetical protein
VSSRVNYGGPDGERVSLSILMSNLLSDRQMVHRRTAFVRYALSSGEVNVNKQSEAIRFSSSPGRVTTGKSMKETARLLWKVADVLRQTWLIS